MTSWVDVVKVDALDEGERVVAEVEGSPVIVFNLGGAFYAIEDVCSHDGNELASGKLEGDEIICPRHGARFCIRNGHVTKPPAFEDIAAFPVRIAHGIVQVRDDR